MQEKEYQRYGRNKKTLINNAYIDNGEYRRKFDSITTNKAVNRQLYEKAKQMLKHRAGTLFEDMYWLDGDTGEVVTAILNSKEEERVRYTNVAKEMIQGRKNLIALHNHPSSMPPSPPDLISAYRNNYRLALIICHDGRVFLYKAEQEIREEIANLYIVKFKKMGCNEYEAQIKMLEELQQQNKIEFKEVIYHEHET